MDSKKVFWLVAGAGAVWLFVSVAQSDNSSRQTMSDVESSNSAFEEKYGHGEKGAGAENGNKWVYRAKDDAMRSQRYYFATETSTNAMVLIGGIGGASRMVLGVRRLHADVDDAYLVINNGQFHCRIDSCEISVKFDDKPVEAFAVAEPRDSGPDTLFVRTSYRFIEELKASKKAIIEASFYEDGAQQFTFNTQNLHWPPTKQDLAD